MGKLDKLINEVMNLNKNLRFSELSKILAGLGYIQKQPRRGGSHYTFRKKGRDSITIPKENPINVTYVELIRDVLIEEGFENE
ncbi:MAG: toxin HicA [Oscillospiraceae bacterium]|nr:toxin HicA [Oscillospiraceae bacterium]